MTSELRELAAEIARLSAAVETIRLTGAENAREIQALRAKDDHFSGTHKAITKELIPSLKSQVDLERQSDIAQVKSAMDELRGEVQELKKSSLIEVTKEGVKSLVPAAPLAAEVGIETAKVSMETAKDSKKALNLSRHPIFALVAYIIMDAIYSFLRRHM